METLGRAAGKMTVVWEGQREVFGIFDVPQATSSDLRIRSLHALESIDDPRHGFG